MTDFDADLHAARMRADGFTIVPDFLSPAAIDAVRAGLAPFLGGRSGRNNFEGTRTERVYTLVARGRVFEDLVEDDRLVAILDRFLQPGYLLTASQAINIHPGETPQPIHADDQFYPLPRPRPAVSVSMIAAVDAFTLENGATEVIRASHTLSDAEIAGSYDGLVHDAPTARSLEERLEPVLLPAGGCVVFLGTLMHRGGANRSAAPRLAFSNQYCEPWARTQENFFLGIPPERVAPMSPRVRRMLGYHVWPPFMGHVSAVHPEKTLVPGWVAPVVRESGGEVAGGLESGSRGDRGG